MPQSQFQMPHFSRRYFSKLMTAALLLSSVVASSPRAFASGTANQCMVLFESADIRKVRVAAEAQGLLAKLNASMRDPNLSLNHRGVFASHPALSTELEAAMSEYGVMSWGARIYVAKSVEAAVAHSAAEPDLLMQGNYIIRPDVTADQIKALKAEELADFYRAAIKSDSLYYIENTFETDPKTGLALIDPTTQRPRGLKQSVRKVDPRLVSEVVHPEELSLHTEDLNAGPFLYQSAWAMPRLRGVIDRENIYDPPNSEGVSVLSGKYSKARSLARKLHAQGFKFTFNRDFEQSLNKVRDQKRRNPVSKEQAEAVKKLSAAEQAKFEEDLWVANSRYKDDPALYASTLAAYGHGKAFSVEVWNEKGELVGGIIGKVEGGLFSPESTFYNEKQYPDIGIMFSMITVDMLGERLAAAGLRYQDAGMVSPFTKSARGQLVTLEKFLNIKDELNRIGTGRLDLTSEWVPPAAVDSATSQKKNRVQKEPGQNAKPEAIQPIPSGDLQATARAIIARAEASLDNPELSLSYRGFISSGPPPTPELNALLAKRGIFNWGVRFFVVDSIGAAKKHSARETDNFMQGNYIILPGLNEAELKQLIQRSGPDAFREVIAKGEVVYVENTFEIDPASGLAQVDPVTKQAVGLKQRVRRVRRDVLEQSVDSNQMGWQLAVPEVGPYLVQSGWVLPQGRGVIERDNIFNPPDKDGRRSLSTSYKNILYFARKKAREGFKFTFNRDFRRALDMTRDQERRDSDGSWSSETSRYKDAETYNAALASFNAGTGISVEVWNEKGELVGGALAFREGPIFKIDSVFYDNRKYQKEGIDFAKAAGVMLGERLAEAGIPILDMEMLSSYSKSLRGRVVSTKYFFTQIDNLDPNAQVDLVTPWNPPSAESYQPPRSR